MAGKRSLTFAELHVEKIVLGAAAAFTLGIAVYAFLIGPNKVEYGNKKLDPASLNEDIAQRADRLKGAVGRAREDVPQVREYAKDLEQLFRGGIFAQAAGAGTPLPETLSPNGAFGVPLPEFKDDQGGEKPNIVVVTPLRPTTPVVSTGRSVVRRKQAALAPFTPTSEPAEKAEEPVEISWVTIAGYFDKDAQRREMGNAGYAPYRAGGYIVGVDAQRQELLASGEFGPFTDVTPAKVVPKLDLPQPVLDERKGGMVNQEELDKALEMVKAEANQESIIQPDFYQVEAGDQWWMPALRGHEPAEEEEPEAVPVKGPEKKREEKKQVGPPPGPGPIIGPVPPGRGTGPWGGGPLGQTGRQSGPQGGGEQGVGAVRREVTKNLTEANKALRKKDYQQAQQFAGAVVNNPQASKAQQKQAQSIIDRAQEALKKEVGKGVGPPGSGPPIYGPQGYGPPIYGPQGYRPPISGVAGGGAGGGWQPPSTPGLITDPKSNGNTIAVWTHDDSVQPGKTYRYRLRVRLWNRYVGRAASLQDPAQAKQTVLVGEWSLPGDPVVVAPKMHFFVRGPKWGEPAATVEVFTWHKGNWLKENFDVRVGDVIGAVKEVKTGTDEDGKTTRESVDFTTGAVVLDVRMDEPVMNRQSAGKQGEFNYRDTKSLVLVYLDPADGQVKERVAVLDQRDRLYKKLKDEVETATP